MGAFSIWHWIIVLAVLVLLYAVPVIAVRRENSEMRTTRKKFLLWTMGILIFAIAANALITDYPGYGELR